MIIHCDFNPHALTCEEEYDEFIVQLHDSEKEVTIDIRGSSVESIKRISEAVCNMLNM